MFCSELAGALHFGLAMLASIVGYGGCVIFNSTHCIANKWGENCTKICSQHCFKGSCDRLNGFCDKGCMGFSNPPYCSRVCTDNSFGPNCSLKCSSNCKNQQHKHIKSRDDTVCDHVTGDCYHIVLLKQVGEETGLPFDYSTVLISMTVLGLLALVTTLIINALFNYDTERTKQEKSDFQVPERARRYRRNSINKEFAQLNAEVFMGTL